MAEPDDVPVWAVGGRGQGDVGEVGGEREGGRGWGGFFFCCWILGRGGGGGVAGAAAAAVEGVFFLGGRGGGGLWGGGGVGVGGVVGVVEGPVHDGLDAVAEALHRGFDAHVPVGVGFEDDG